MRKINKKAKIATVSALVLVMMVFAVIVYAAPKKCSNNVDDDNDGLVDYPNDPGCSGRSDNTETSSFLVCDNGLDETNDADTLADYRLSGGDLGCTSTTDTSEVDGDCDDLSDNDGDTFTDYPNDLGCTGFSDTSELGGVQCDDGVDNDGDSLVDYPDDAGCNGLADDDETNCGDGVCEGGETQQSCPQDCGFPDSCSDTDGGFVVTMQGTVSGYSGGNPFSYTDFCLSNITLTEQYCNVNSPLNSNYDCSQGGNTTGTCLSGACV